MVESQSRDTQCKQIVEYIKEHGMITSAAAMNDLGIYRLASRIHDLKKMGYDIGSEWVNTINRWGKTVRYKFYTLRLEEGSDAK